MAAAHETGLLTGLEAAVVASPAAATLRLSFPAALPRRRLLLTLLFLTAVGLHRTRNLRSYTGEALGLLTGRQRAYSFWHTERFLTHMAQAGGAEILTDALGTWATHLWSAPLSPTSQPPVCLYIDSHRKPVYSDHLIPRGLIGRTGKILGCRTLVLLHDAAGHPQLVLTARGDQHLTSGLPDILTRYEQTVDSPVSARVIVDREGMAAPFLQDLKARGYTVVTVLRSDQYDGLEAFTEVGVFVPLEWDRDGQVVREVAPACFAVPLPDQAEAVLPLRVALIRDLRRQVPDTRQRDELDEDMRAPSWWQAEWKAKPLPATPTTPKLIPIVTTAATCDAVELAQTYTRRWPVQENVIRDWLLPVGLDTNHGYRKTPTVNSEVAKKRAALEKRLSTLERWTTKARDRAQRASRLYDRRWKQTKAYGDEQYRILTDHQTALREQGMEMGERHALIKQEQKLIDADLEQRWQRVWRAYHQSSAESQKGARYAQKQRVLLRALADLAATERTMYELDNRKDQVMTVLKLALTNLAMWVRDCYFPASYAHATWGRLTPFFHLEGQVRLSQDEVSVALRPFHDRQYTRDLVALCQQVNAAHCHLPDGRVLRFSVQDLACPVLHGQER